MVAGTTGVADRDRENSGDAIRNSPPLARSTKERVHPIHRNGGTTGTRVLLDSLVAKREEVGGKHGQGVWAEEEMLDQQSVRVVLTQQACYRFSRTQTRRDCICREDHF